MIYRADPSIIHQDGRTLPSLPSSLEDLVHGNSHASTVQSEHRTLGRNTSHLVAGPGRGPPSLADLPSLPSSLDELVDGVSQQGSSYGYNV